MKVLVLYRPNSEYARAVEEFIHDFQGRNPGYTLDVQSIDTRDGAALASLYDIMSYPAMLALRNDGYIQIAWQGMPLPLIDEVAAYIRS